MNFQFPNLLKNPFKEKSYLGVDIGTASVKIVEIADTKGKPTIRNYGILETQGHLERLNDVIQTSSLKISDKETAGLLRALIKEIRPKSNIVAASLPAFTAFTALFEVPAMSEKETAQAMQYQAKTLVPLPLTEVAIDWLPVGEYQEPDGTRKRRIFLVSIPNDQIRKYQEIFKAAGLVLSVLEIETLSLARALTTGDPTNTLIVDIGARSTALAVASGGLLKHSSQTDFAGGSLTQAVASGLGINARRAEELKKQRGLTGAGGEYEVSTLMLPYLDVIISEARRVKVSYEKSYGDKVERVIFSGGGSNLSGIEKYAAKQLGLPTVHAAPLIRFVYPPSMAPFATDLGASLAVSLGLGLREFKT